MELLHSLASQTWFIVLMAAMLIGGVLSAVHHAEVVAHKTGEPYGPSSVIKKFMSFDATKKPTKTASAPTIATPTLTSAELPDFMK